jgi:hypothetical protein
MNLPKDWPDARARWVVPDTGYTELIEPHILRAIEEKHNAIETMCERMLTDPEGRGVLVTDYPDAGWTVALSPDVPWGEIHYWRAQRC